MSSMCTNVPLLEIPFLVNVAQPTKSESAFPSGTENWYEFSDYIIPVGVGRWNYSPFLYWNIVAIIVFLLVFVVC